ncbi:MAG: hypothetical protein NTV29_04745 [Planctomycetota bacterium]|nr:hypothetical protein [Planctomycetota bacterium]
MSISTACQLLVSANTLEECILLQELKVPWIDLKEPRHGPLGRPELPLVKQFAAGMTSASSRVPHWSIAGGELPDWNSESDAAFIKALGAQGPERTNGHIKWGLARAEQTTNWREKLSKIVAQTPSPEQVILVHYADYRRVDAPDWNTVLSAAAEQRIDKILIDTAVKDGSKLTDWLEIHLLEQRIQDAKRQNFQIAIAGSIPLDQLAKLSRLEPNWIGVRGAVCRNPRDRTSTIDQGLVAKALAHVGQPCV